MTSLLLPAVLGLVVGLVMGALGGGGAVIAVPVLVYLLDQPIREATTISLVVVLFGAVVGLVSMRGEGRVDWRTGLVFGGLGLGGSVLGARLSVLADPRVLMAGFAVLLAVVGAITWRHARRDETAARRSDEVSLTQLVPTAFGVGTLTGFFGVGGGFVTVPALAVVMRLPALVATSTSLVVIAVNAAAALATRLLGGGVPGLPWGLVTVFAAATGAGTWAGNRLAGRARGAVLLRAFAVFLVVLAVVVGTEALRS
ncbi:sulfite exporter TauE/SafE family protein [Terrabacter sp. C0L_2]|uniref:sulfite exporter TauE/SafE family protein n=1 Tax=Terrabacter sp. C0L_2 TaxID=3108389 RepID=UPI002ECFFBD5|nr:sulfite exporter TauE/SafE family protein [Terrabacter sp. C0L_2]